jgi:polyhydroxyalkanoate synthesis regulator phasin
MNIESTQDQTPNRTRRVVAVGVATGLLGGGAIGLLLTVPSITSAVADDERATVVPVMALQDDATDVSEIDRPEPGERLRDLLQQLVDDGTLDDDEADAVVALLMENRPERDDRSDRTGRPDGRFGGRHLRPGADGEVIAGLLGIDVETLRAELEVGNSVADIATANEVDPQTVITALVTEAEAHIDQMVEDGRVTADEAAARLDQITEQITARVNGERPVHG